MADIFELFKKIGATETLSKAPVKYIIAGLGNYGSEYENTRHNAGFRFMDYLSGKTGAKINRLKFRALCGETVIAENGVLLMKPQTYMNNSGEAIREAADFYKVTADRVIVIYDDIYLDPGKVRIRRKGSAGGHNGIKSIIENLKTEEFPRGKIGVGTPPKEFPMVNWVLGNIPESDMKLIEGCYDRIYGALPDIIKGNVDLAMSRCNC